VVVLTLLGCPSGKPFVGVGLAVLGSGAGVLSAIGLPNTLMLEPLACVCTTVKPKLIMLHLKTNFNRENGFIISD
jgi:hypothetical protein